LQDGGHLVRSCVLVEGGPCAAALTRPTW
jgi:hypothetical protein